MSEPRLFWIYETMVSGKFREGWYSQNPCPFKSHYIEIQVIEKSAYDELKTKLDVAVEALEFECGNRCAIGLNPCNARETLAKIRGES